MEPYRELVIEDRGGETHVFLDPGGEHIVTRRVAGRDGQIVSIQVPFGSPAWTRAVRRASTGAALT